MIREKYLHSKIMPPKVLHPLLPVKNIADIIDSVPPDEVIYLVAPYGYGKTLAVISWLRERNRKAAWLTLDESDNEEEVFFADVSASVMRLSGWTGTPDDILSSPEYTSDHQSFFWKTVSDVKGDILDKILVIDSFRFLQDPALLVSFKNIISNLLGYWRVIIISRAEPPSLFNDIIMKRKLYLITIKELAFNAEEIKEFFIMNDCSISDEEVLTIRDKTEGWPASLNVVLTLSRGGSVIYSDAVHEYISEFFETEIWKDLNHDIKTFLLKTSVLDHLTPTLCNAVTGMYTTLPMLRYLFVNGLFLSRSDQHETFRYHRVFQSFLREKLNTSDIDEIDLYKKIGWWLFERDNFQAAFPYFFKAGDLYGLSRLFRVINPADLGPERFLELTKCITQLQVEDLQEYPIIIAKMALIHFYLGNLEEMQCLYDIFTQFITSGIPPMMPEEYIECMWEANWLSFLNPSGDILSMEHKDCINYGDYNLRLTKYHDTRCAAYRFPSILRGIREICPLPENSPAESYQNPYHDRVYPAAGENALLQREIVKAEYAYELENITAAEKIIHDVMSKAEALQFTDLYLICIALLIKIVKVRGVNGIDALLARLKKMIIKNGHTYLLPRFHAVELRSKLMDGYIGQTDAFAAENKDYMDKPYFFLIYNHIVLARALLSTGAYHETILLLANLEHFCRRYSRTIDVIEVNILQSIAAYRLNHEDSASSCLLDAIDRARKYGFIRIFSDDAKGLWPILKTISSDTNDTYIKNIIISCKKTLSAAGVKLSQRDETNVGLTKTELKMLKILQTNLSYEEIAFDNNIKVSTVKSHIHSIYSKLDVGNRVSAISAAQDLGIIN